MPLIMSIHGVAVVYHAVSALLLRPIVADRVAAGCFEHCGLDMSLHWVSAVAVGWPMVIWYPAYRSAHRLWVRFMGGVQMAAGLLWVSLCLLASTTIGFGRLPWSVNLAVGLAAAVHGAVQMAARSKPQA